jgi:hypothetical protein
MRRDERISTRRIASNVTAAAIRPNAPSHGVALMLLHDAATTAKASSASWRAGTGVGRSACVEVGLSTTTAAAAASPISTTSDQNASRHVAYCANTPPTAGPSSVAMPHMPESSASARGHSGLGSTLRISTYGADSSTPPPSPCSTRPASSTGMAGASAHSAEPPPNTAAPSR